MLRMCILWNGFEVGFNKKLLDHLNLKLFSLFCFCEEIEINCVNVSLSPVQLLFLFIFSLLTIGQAGIRWKILQLEPVKDIYRNLPFIPAGFV